MARAMKDSGIAWIGEIAEDFEVIKLKYLCDILDQYRSPITADQRNQDADVLYDYYGASGAIDKIDGYTIDDHVMLIGEDGANLRMRNLPLMYEVNGKAWINNHAHILKPKSEADFYYLFYALEALDLNTYITGSAQPKLSQESLKNIWIPIPQYDTQKKISSVIRKKCLDIDTLMEQTRASIKEYNKLKQAVITQAVTKGIRPNRPMKYSGIEWIGRLPEDWKVIRAKYCVEINNGSDPKTEGNIPVYGSGAASFKTCGEYKEGPCVLIGRKGATLHIPHYIEGKYWNVDTAFDVKTQKEYSLKYYYYAACCFDYKLYISQTTLPGMTQTNYENMFLPCPTPDQQQIIVDYLDNKLKDLDLLIQKKEQLLNGLDTYKKSLIFGYVTGKKALGDD